MSVAVNGGGVSSGAMGSAAGMKTSTSAAVRLRSAKDNRNKRPRKKLNYNPREISSQLLRAKKSNNASVVLIRAKGKLSVLYKAYASGQYNNSEVQIAIVHARRMVECSRIKVRNLKEEEMIEGRNNRDKINGEQKKKSEIKRRVRKKERDAKVKMALEENQRVLKEKTKHQILLQKRRMHRNDEQGKVLEADLKYLEDQMKNTQSENTSGYDGVSVDISMAAAQMSELQIMEQQIEQEAALEVEIEFSAADAAAMSSAGAPGADMGVSTAAAPSIDIAI